MTIWYLPHKSVPWQVSTDGIGATGSASSLVLLGTTAPAWESFGNPEWWADLEYVWRMRTSAVRDQLHARARRRAKQARDAPQDTPRLRVVAARAAEWAEHRARAVAMARRDLLATCMQRWRATACGCKRVEVRVGCDQPQLCGRCRKRHSAKWSKRIRTGLDVALRRERRAWYGTPGLSHVGPAFRSGKPPGVYLITLTGPHSGDIETDRRVLGIGVRKLLKHANKYRWWSTYALTWECTPGRGDGHVHCHMAVISSWFPYSLPRLEASEVPAEALRATEHRKLGESWPWTWRRRVQPRGLREVWADAVPGATVLEVSPPRKGADDVADAAGYLAKYVTKGVDPSEFTGAKAGELLCAFRGRRKVSTSSGFWDRSVPTCECCGEVYENVETPCSLQDIAPGGVLRSKAERLRWWIPRGNPQAVIRWEAT